MSVLKITLPLAFSPLSGDLMSNVTLASLLIFINHLQVTTKYTSSLQFHTENYNCLGDFQVRYQKTNTLMKNYSKPTV